jgi:hypothetical protein
MELVGSRRSTLVRKVLLMSETLNLSFVHKIVTAETVTLTLIDSDLSDGREGSVGSRRGTLERIAPSASGK